MESRTAVTGLLQDWASGNRRALDRLVPYLYDELKRLARHRLHGERAGHTLGTTGLVHEAYLRLVDFERVSPQSRAHFMAMASRVMRRVLVDHARHRNARKRGGGEQPVTLENVLHLASEDATRFLELETALERLGSVSERKVEIVEQHYFGGLTIDEIAESAGLSRSTVRRELRFARAWLAVELGGGPAPDQGAIA